MDTSAVFVRTAQGQQGFTQGASALSSGQRTVLVLVDGKRTAQDVNRVVQAVCNGYATLGQLIDLGYIEQTSIALLATQPVVRIAANAAAPIPRAEAMAEAKRYAAKSLADQLGPVADRVCLRIELSNSAKDLMEAITQGHRMLKEFVGSARASAYESHIKFLLSDELAQTAA
jgi:hypothetical protein